MDLAKIATALRLLADAIHVGEELKAASGGNAKAARGKAKETVKNEAASAAADAAAAAVAGAVTSASKEEVIQSLQAVMKKHGRAALDAILADFNVASVGALDPSNYADVVTNAKAKVNEG